MITVLQKGNFEKTISFLEKARHPILSYKLDRYGRRGIEALSSMTPVNTGKTANSWRYEIEVGKDSSSISFYNDNNNNGVNIAIILQYGHGTNNGGYVQGIDYINPALRPVFNELAESVWREVVE